MGKMKNSIITETLMGINMVMSITTERSMGMAMGMVMSMVISISMDKSDRLDMNMSMIMINAEILRYRV